MKDIISHHDRVILRELARRQMEHARSEKNRQLIRDWCRHNACKGERPMIHLELWTFQQEIIPPLLRCESESARQIETLLYNQFLNRELFDDDRPVPDYFPISWDVRIKPFDLAVRQQHTTGSDGRESVGHQFVHQINDLAEDFLLMKPSPVLFDRAAVLERFNQIADLFGDWLPPRLVGRGLYSVPTQDLLHIMSMETMYISMIDYPEIFHQMMRQYTDDTLRLYRFMEHEKLMLPTTAYEELGQGTWCFTNELPAEPVDGSLKASQLWGFMDSQETVGLSPDMFGEFIFPYYQEISSEYGLLSYGCCEPVHAIWDEYLSTLPNLRKVSISPWCDEAMMGDRLQGRKVIYHRKPSPNLIGVGTVLDEAAVREHIRTTLRAARNLTLEITQRDVYTINHDIAKARRYVEIFKEEIINHW